MATKDKVAALLVSTLRDGGSEFQGELEDFLQTEGVKIRTIPRYDHSGNGRIEAINRAISDAARVMLIDSMLPLSYWPYAVTYAALISNHILLHGKDKVPAVLMGKLQLKEDKFMRFGCRVLFHLAKELQRGKFEPHSLPGIFLGLSDDGFNYLIYSINDDRVIPTRAVHGMSSPVAGNGDVFLDSPEGLDYEDYYEFNEPLDEELMDLESDTDMKSDADTLPTSPVIGPMTVKEPLPATAIQNGRESNTAIQNGRESHSPTFIHPSGREDKRGMITNSEKLRKLPTHKSRIRAARKEQKRIAKLSSPAPVSLSRPEPSTLRRSSRVNEYTRMKIRESAAAFSATDLVEPKSWKAAIEDPLWKQSMDLEFQQLMELDSWNYVKADPNKIILRSHWVYKLKADGRKKSRLTIDGRDHFVADTYASVGTKESGIIHRQPE